MPLMLVECGVDSQNSLAECRAVVAVRHAEIAGMTETLAQDKGILILKLLCGRFIFPFPPLKISPPARERTIIAPQLFLNRVSRDF